MLHKTRNANGGLDCQSTYREGVSCMATRSHAGPHEVADSGPTKIVGDARATGPWMDAKNLLRDTNGDVLGPGARRSHS
jgi:hypothetical protein